MTETSLVIAHQSGEEVWQIQVTASLVSATVTHILQIAANENPVSEPLRFESSMASARLPLWITGSGVAETQSKSRMSSHSVSAFLCIAGQSKRVDLKRPRKWGDSYGRLKQELVFLLSSMELSTITQMP